MFSIYRKRRDGFHLYRYRLRAARVDESEPRPSSLVGHICDKREMCMVERNSISSQTFLQTEALKEFKIVMTGTADPHKHTGETRPRFIRKFEDSVQGFMV